MQEQGLEALMLSFKFVVTVDGLSFPGLIIVLSFLGKVLYVLLWVCATFSICGLHLLEVTALLDPVLSSSCS